MSQLHRLVSPSGPQGGDLSFESSVGVKNAYSEPADMTKPKPLLGYLFILPSFLFLTLFAYYPVVQSVWSSLRKQVPFEATTRFVGASNYVEMFNNPLFQKVVMTSTVFSVISVALSMGLGLLLALLLNRTRSLSGLFRFAIFYPNIIPMVAGAMVWVFLFSPTFGPINHVLARLGLPSGIDWLGSTPYALAAVILVSVWKYCGFYMLLFLAGLQSIDEQLYEAAKIEGVTQWHQFWYITFPLLSPTTFFVLLIAFVNSLRALDHIFVMTNGGPANSTNVLLFYIYQTGFVFWNTGYASAVAVFLFAALFVFTWLYFKALNRRVYYSS